MEPLLVIAIMGGVFALAIAAARSHHAHQVRELDRLAALLGGTVRTDAGWFASLDRTRVRGTYERHAVEVQYEVRGSGKSKRTYAVVQVRVRAAIADFRIRPAGVLKRIGRWLGLVSDTKTGNERVDDAFILDGRPDALAGLFAQGEAERHLRALFREQGASEVALRGGTLSIRFQVNGVARAKVASAILNLVSLAKLCDRKPIEVRIKGAAPGAKRFGWTGGTEHAMCPYCRDQIESAEELPLSACSSCHTVHHTECLEEAGGCTVFGCGGGRRAGERVR
ncbi:MAG: hypothetical protein KDD82_03320 [Planctomycetes bacterium]|nr:hypothetical protein [Planctomycetota bacterium]